MQVTDDHGQSYLYAYPKGCQQQAWSVACALWGFERIITGKYKMAFNAPLTDKNTMVEESKPLEAPVPDNVRETTEALSESMLTFIYQDNHKQHCLEAGRPHFYHQEWGRDTMIALLGVISAGWYEDAEDLLIKWAGWERNGIIPNVKGWGGGAAENENTSDASLWFVEAVDQFIQASGQADILDKEIIHGKTLRQALRNIVKRYTDETGADSVHGNAKTGFVYVPKQSTMMDTKYTPRQGYPVEIQALWYNALRKMARMDPSAAGRYNERADLVKSNFEKYFWNTHEDTVYDILGTEGVKSPDEAVPDPAVRFNQIFAVYCGLVEGEMAKKIIGSTMDRLRLPGALRSLAMPAKVYKQTKLEDGRNGWEAHKPQGDEKAAWPFAEFHHFYETGADREVRDNEYHNGTGWVWPYPFLWVSAVREGVIEKNQAVKEMDTDYRRLMRDPWTGGSNMKLGSLPECTDATVFTLKDEHGHDYFYAYPKACGEQAWSVSGAIWGFEKVLGAEAIRPISTNVYARAHDKELKGSVVTPVIKTAEEIIVNAEQIIPRLVNGLITWAKRAPRINPQEQVREKRVLVINIGHDESKEAIASIYHNLAKALKMISANNKDIAVILEDVYIIIGNNSNTTTRLNSLASAGKEGERIKYENVLVVTPEEDRDAFENLTGGKALITAFDDSELKIAGEEGLDYLPVVEVAFFAVLRALGRLDARSTPEDRGYYRESLWKWYTHIPNIDIKNIDKAMLMRMCFDAQGRPRRTVILRLIPSAQKNDTQKLDNINKAIGALIRRA